MIMVAKADLEAFMSASKIGEFQISCLQSVRILVWPNGTNIKGLIEDGLDKAIAMPQVYSALRKLATMGLLSSELETDRPKGQIGAARRFYKLTELGVRYLKLIEEHIPIAKED